MPPATGKITNALRRDPERKAERRAHKAHHFKFNLKLQVKDDEIIHGRDHHPLAGAHATVESAGDIDRRVTASRLMLTGPLAFGLRKKKDNREVFLTIEGDGFGFVQKVNPSDQKAARDFAAKLNAVA